jgi:hypothetical protein
MGALRLTVVQCSGVCLMLAACAKTPADVPPIEPAGPLVERCLGENVDTWACMDLSARYHFGVQGVPHDEARSFEFGKRACDNGVTVARSPIGRQFCRELSQRNGIDPPLGFYPHGR